MSLRAPLVMAAVAVLAAAAGIIAVARPTRGDEAARYRRRIAGTMLLALAVILGLFSYGLQMIGTPA